MVFFEPELEVLISFSRFKWEANVYMLSERVEQPSAGKFNILSRMCDIKSYLNWYSIDHEQTMWKLYFDQIYCSVYLDSIYAIDTRKKTI